MALERRLLAGLGARTQITVRRWLSKIAADLQQDGWFRRYNFAAPLSSPLDCPDETI
jgi:hypothetical protein